MKKTALLLVAIAAGLIAYGQNPVPPKEVQDAFSAKFKSAQDIVWEQEGSEWEAEFKSGDTEMSASFDNSGKWLETEREMSKKELPAEIHKAINLQFDGWEIDEIEAIEKPGFTGYEIALEKEGTETEILVTITGDITIKKVKVEDDDEEGDD
jgi:hypothetical protein